MLREKKYVTTREVADELRCSPGAVRGMVKAKVLTAVRLPNRRFLFDRSDLARVIEQPKAAPASACA